MSTSSKPLALPVKTYSYGGKEVSFLYDPRFDSISFEEHRDRVVELCERVTLQTTAASQGYTPEIDKSGSSVTDSRGVQLLSKEEEEILFTALNFYRFSAWKALQQSPAAPRQCSEHLRMASEVEQTITKANLGLLYQAIRKWLKSNRLRNISEFESSGQLALIDAIRRFNFRYGTKFSTYAIAAIRHRFIATADRESAVIARSFHENKDINIQPLPRGEIEKNPKLKSMLERAAMTLPYDQSDILGHRYGLWRYRVLSTEKIAARLKITVSELETTERRALRSMRERISQLYPELILEEGP